LPNDRFAQASQFILQIGQEYVESLAEEFALRQAIKLNEFELYYQPVIELTTHEVIGERSAHSLE
jgi:sensor c-di-GMP phosphodiesterase-like protein